MKTLLVVICSLLLTAGAAHAVYDGHVYLSGAVNAISGSFITVNGVQYYVTPRAKIDTVIKSGGAYHERHATMADVVKGSRVTIKVTDKTVHEILIRGY